MVWPIMGDACRRSIHLKNGVEASQRVRGSLSKLFRNVPFLTSVEMSPFLCFASVTSFVVVFLEKFASECPRNDDPLLHRPTGSHLAWPGAQPCVARRAKRLGRSGGPGQRRA